MYITRVPNRDSPPAVLLRESYREGGKVKNRTLANLSSWPEAKVEALSRALKGLPPAGLDGAFEISRSRPHGHVAAVFGTIRALGLEQLIGPAPSPAQDLVIAMITAAVTGGSSELATARGLRPDRGQHAGRGSPPGSLRRGRPVCGDGLAAAPPGGDRGRAGRPAPGRRHAGAV